MATSNCNQNCGCSNSYTVTAPCPPSCTEVFNAQCIVYTGTDIVCGTDTVISRYDYMDTVITKIINYFCTRLDSVPTTVVESDDPAIVVTSQVVGSVTTYVLTLDPASFPAVGQVTAGDNVVVTGTGTGADPYVVNANESIVAVDPTSALTLIVDPSTPGPYETTYTVGLNISSIYSNVAGDTGNVAASSLTDTLEILGAAGSGITTAIISAPGIATLEIDWAGIEAGAGISGTGRPGDPVVCTANVYETISGDGGSPTTASGLTDTLNIVGGTGVQTTVSADTVTIDADVAKYVSASTLITTSPTGVSFTHNLNTADFSLTVRRDPFTSSPGIYALGIDYEVDITNVNTVVVRNITGSDITVIVTVIG
jgi:hypothetical protein